MVAPVLIGAGIGAALGLLKTKNEQNEVERMNEAQAELTRYSPWTGMKGQMQAAPSTFGGVMQGAALGAMGGSMMPAAGAAAGTAGATSGATTAASTAGATGAAELGAGSATGLASSPMQQSAFNEAAMQAGTSQAPQQMAQGASMFSGIPGLDQNAPNYAQMGMPSQGGGQLPPGSKWASMQQPGQRQF